MKIKLLLATTLLCPTLAASAQDVLPLGGPMVLPPNAVKPHVMPMKPATVQKTVKPVQAASSKPSTPNGNCVCHSASIAYDAGNYALAANLYTQAADSMVKSFGTQDVADVANMRYNAALAYHQMTNYAKAESNYKQALAIWKKIGDTTVDVAWANYGLANIYHDRGQLKESRQMYLAAAANFNANGDTKDYDDMIALAGS